MEIHAPKSNKSITWLGLVVINRETLKHFYSESQLQVRALQWFKLGHSLGSILHFSNPADFRHALLAMLERFDFRGRNTALQGVQLIKSTFSNTKPAPTEGNRGTLVTIDTPLVCPDYWQVLPSLLDVLKCVYQRMVVSVNGLPVPSQSDITQMVEIDGLIKHNIIGLLSKDLTACASRMIDTELALPALFPG
ncbi:hypothetical protein J8273_0381 [Carpediemonas membranifera]|uniref:Uncharacterized protein n=1 Tax=Carpediemonas membranifera TaxID=201153 RepID=A0A8J6AUM5_9EUKA|nr:hypothetical protein J8273_0381 [Carpediemonas membranifera]|eukprot:KAG9395161.1 hypothetical protein J8273_0381 [Carpediemonas membranifera]